tara:strand:- start:1737 stop:2042 length:306 start_codon:yes stop_codon:yes gene_type:complete
MSEELARKFHEAYERLAPSFGYETRKETRDFDPTSANGKLMIAVCDEVAGDLEAENERLVAKVNRLTAFEDLIVLALQFYGPDAKSLRAAKKELRGETCNE